MALRLWNTLENRLVEVEPVKAGEIRMYNCGPTVYSDPHIGNFRSFLLGDLLRRAFDQRGFKTTQVMNITDVGHLTTDDVADASGEDKLEKKAKEEGLDPFEIALRYEQMFHENASQLHLVKAHEYPRATDHIPEMIQMIEQLLERGHAYAVKDVGVYFRVHSFEKYGGLSGNTLENLDSGSRIEVDERKESAHDFALWKIDDKHLMQWDSPWGRGFPGWHIECSAMSLKYLGGTFDIHTGGEDNIFPHHECEIAQSVGAGVGEFARIWVHARHLLVDGQKMSKSKGNFYTINDLVERGFSGHEIRYSLICNHYRQPMNFTIDGMDGDTKAVQRLRTLRKKLEEASVGSAADTEVDAPLEESMRQFDACIDDDLNLSGALGVLHDRVRALGRDLPEGSAALRALEFLRHCDQILGVIFVEDESPTVPLTDSQQQLIQRRETARAEREWSLADEIRDQLLAEGILIEDGPTGTTWSHQR
ncbi:MAG: cysteine--tRNA ligase [Planctomycetes bacterium]|jgi:cysteinyl-tRNA synthetase|nr:cysteine--tRNA ligase [Planctomycetota bacterium]MBT6453038.1 cysteine--tRNA ligase [Planctomycetota bacterium]MBT6541934.1 cysteine--tRNA ligase [Planctomycetota bacterium]MBT6785130.1 cysteine--tRNA ligase [Planctomycetota bacterium]MBT6968123.1 cysteine--tRNA ligase [Planctomycetota bacterium]